MSGSGGLGTAVSSESDNVMVTSSYPTFSSGDLDTDLVDQKTLDLDQRQDDNNSLVGNGPMSTMSPRSQDGRSYSSNNSSQDNRNFNASVQDSLNFSHAADNYTSHATESLNFSSHVSVPDTFSTQDLQDSLTFSSNDDLNFKPHSSVPESMKFSSPAVLDDNLAKFSTSDVNTSLSLDIKSSEQSNVCKVIIQLKKSLEVIQ